MATQPIVAMVELEQSLARHRLDGQFQSAEFLCPEVEASRISMLCDLVQPRLDDG